MSILKGLFVNKGLETELEKLKNKYNFLKIDFDRIIRDKKCLQNQIKNYELLKRELELKHKELKTSIESLEKKCQEETIERIKLIEELSKSIENENKLKKELSILKLAKDNEVLKRLNLEKELESLHKTKKNLDEKYIEEKSKDTIGISIEEKELEKKEISLGAKMEIENEVITKEEIKIINFCNLLSKGLKNGFLDMEELKKIDYNNDVDAYDIYEAIEILEERGIRINY